MKVASKGWMEKGEVPPKKAKMKRSAGKVMLARVLGSGWNVVGRIHATRADNNEGNVLRYLNEAAHCDQTKATGELRKEIVLLHDNAPAHSSDLIQSLLRDFAWDVFPHPPYSPNLAASDFQLFPHLHRWLDGQRFSNNQKVINAVNEHFAKLNGAYYKTGIENVLRYDKYFNVFGDYVEK